MLIVLLLPATGSGWGYEGHSNVNEVAAGKIPRSMPRFFRKGKKWLTYLGYEPDRWRDDREAALKSAQSPDHFLDLELLDGITQLPPDRYSFYQLLAEKRASTPGNPEMLLPQKVGLQPYIVIEVYDRLKASFREYRLLKELKKPTKNVERKIVFYAGWLGHYVADGAQPLHTTIHYNGWVGDNPSQYSADRTIHYRFESEFVKTNLERPDFADLVQPPTQLANPFADYMQYLRDSNRLVEPLYQLDKAGAFTGAGTAEGRDFVRRRLAAGAQMLVNLWYTAWLESTKPPIPRAPAASPSPPEGSGGLPGKPPAPPGS